MMGVGGVKGRPPRSQTEEAPVQYALLIYSEEKNLPDDWPEDERSAFYDDYRAVSQDMEAKGAHVAARRLQTTDTATTVRVVDGQALTTDGPFAETKEQLGGFYLVDVPDLDTALEWAARCPATSGAVEVRPQMG